MDDTAALCRKLESSGNFMYLDSTPCPGKKSLWFSLLCITVTNLSIFSQFLAQITLIVHFTKTYKIYRENLCIAKYC